MLAAASTPPAACNVLYFATFEIYDPSRVLATARGFCSELKAELLTEKRQIDAITISECSYTQNDYLAQRS